MKYYTIDESLRFSSVNDMLCRADLDGMEELVTSIGNHSIRVRVKGFNKRSESARAEVVKEIILFLDLVRK